MPIRPAIRSLALLFAGVVLSAIAATVDAAPAPAAQPAPAAAVLEASVVLRAPEDGGAVLGAGWLDAETGLIVTTARVAGRRDTLVAVWQDGTRMAVRVIARDRVHDVALLEGWTGGRAGLSIRGDAATPGSFVLAAGVAGDGPALGLGIVGATGQRIDPTLPAGLIRHDAGAAAGGALTDLDGGVVGLNLGREAGGAGHALPAALLRGLIDRMAAGETTEGIRLGADLRPVDPVIAAALNLPGPHGLLVDRVDAGGAGALAGLVAGDVILAAGGATMPAAGPLAEALAGAAGPLEIAVWRAGDLLHLTLRAAEAAPAPLARNLAGPAEVRRRTSLPTAALGVVLDAGGRITRLDPASPAAFSGLAFGETILTVNGQTPGAGGLAAILGNLVTAPAVLLVRGPDGATRHVVLDPWVDPARAKAMDKAPVFL